MTISASRRRSAMDVSHGGCLCSAACQALAQPQDACAAPYQSMETIRSGGGRMHHLRMHAGHLTKASCNVPSRHVERWKATSHPTHTNAKQQYPCMAQAMECSADDRQGLMGSQEGSTCRHVRLRPHARAEQHLLHKGQRFCAPSRLLPRSIHPLVEVALQAGAAGEHIPMSSPNQPPCPWQARVLHASTLVRWCLSCGSG